MSRILLAAAVGGFLTVSISAFAAHGMRDFLDMRAMAWVETGVRFQAWHSLALLGVGALMAVRPSRLLSAAAGAFVFGILLFSGSLYGLALMGLRGFALITPLGGGLSLGGWALLGLYAWRLPRR